MKKYSNKELTQILLDLDNGNVYCGIEHDRGIGRIYKSIYGNIAYEHFGSSAVKFTIRELRWLLENIFDECECITLAEWSNYHINYVPIDKKYQGVDYSGQHPNVFGE